MASAGTAVSAFVKALLERLVDEDEYFRSPAVRSEVKKVKKTLSEIQAFLNDASRKEVTDTSVALWLNKLQHICYDLDDVLDDVATKAMGREPPHESISVASRVRQKFDIITNMFHRSEKDKIDSITRRLQDLVKKQVYLGLTVIGEKPESMKMINEASLLEFNVVGRESEKEKLLNKLLQDDPSSKENYSFITIYGMGGVGKTTLAGVLYNDTLVKDHFELMAWVTVSDAFDVFKMSKTIFQSWANVNLEFKHLNQLQMALAEKLQDKRFLLVLDDVWNENYDEWKELVRPFHFAARGSKIIITTRKVLLLKNLHFQQIGHLECLSHEDSLSLLALHELGVDNFDSYPTLRTRGEDIVKRCHGLPLSLKMVGSLLKTKTHGEGWDDVLNSEIWYSQNDDAILPALRLGYSNLPAHMKQLFAYCSLFPKGFLFDTKNLVLLWLAEGYLTQSAASKFDDSPEHLGHIYFESLLSLSFFQQAPSHKSLFVMHDLMNDLAMSVAGDFFILFDKPLRMVDRAFSRCRHMSFAREKYVGYKQFEAFKRGNSLRTLLAAAVEVNNSSNFFYLPHKILEDVLPHLKLLRVLSLSNCNICEVPDFIGSMKHLRYLNLS